MKTWRHARVAPATAATHILSGPTTTQQRKGSLNVISQTLYILLITSTLLLCRVTWCLASADPTASAKAVTGEVTEAPNGVVHTDHNLLPPLGQVISAMWITPNKTVNFTHLAYDPVSDRLYVGASNYLYQFAGDQLRLEADVATGPVDDSIHCSASDCSSYESQLRRVPNFNKILVIDYMSSPQTLIVCGSVHQGACRRHKLGDIKVKEDLVPVPVAANDETASTVAIIGPSRYETPGNRVTPVLYVAATFTRLGPYRELVPAIAARSLSTRDHNLFHVIETGFSSTAKIDINFHMRDYFTVKYVAGWANQDFIYFALVQKRFHQRALEEWGFVTRLARVCAADSAFKTYTEVTLSCRDPRSGTDYTLLQDSVVIRAGQRLAQSLGIPTGDQVLIGAFAAPAEPHTSTPAKTSAICIYTLKDIETKFNENIMSCYNGSESRRNMEYIAGNVEECPKPGTGGNIGSFCSETLKINGSIPISTLPAIRYDNVTLTAISAGTEDEHTVIFAGTSDGELKQVLLEHAHVAHEFHSTVIDAGERILPDMALTRGGDHLIVASPYRIARVSLQASCATHDGCGSCVRSHNPYCGWCPATKKCFTRQQCKNASIGSLDLSSEQRMPSTKWLAASLGRVETCPPSDLNPTNASKASEQSVMPQSASSFPNRSPAVEMPSNVASTAGTILTPCHVFRTCEACTHGASSVSTSHCGWCPAIDRCTTRLACDKSGPGKYASRTGSVPAGAPHPGWVPSGSSNVCHQFGLAFFGGSGSTQTPPAAILPGARPRTNSNQNVRQWPRPSGQPPITFDDMIHDNVPERQQYGRNQPRWRPDESYGMEAIVPVNPMMEVNSDDNSINPSSAANSVATGAGIFVPILITIILSLSAALTVAWVVRKRIFTALSPVRGTTGPFGGNRGLSRPGHGCHLDRPDLSITRPFFESTLHSTQNGGPGSPLVATPTSGLNTSSDHSATTPTTTTLLRGVGGNQFCTPGDRRRVSDIQNHPHHPMHTTLHPHSIIRPEASLKLVKDPMWIYVPTSRGGSQDSNDLYSPQKYYMTKQQMQATMGRNFGHHPTSNTTVLHHTTLRPTPIVGSTNLDTSVSHSNSNNSGSDPELDHCYEPVNHHPLPPAVPPPNQFSNHSAAQQQHHHGLNQAQQQQHHNQLANSIANSALLNNINMTNSAIRSYYEHS